jgi:transposase-like protein
MENFCPHCIPKRALNKAGRNRSGTQRYRCRGCDYSCTEGGGVQGSLPKYGPTAQTGYGRLKRCIQKKKDAPEK